MLGDKDYYMFSLFTIGSTANFLFEELTKLGVSVTACKYSKADRSKLTKDKLFSSFNDTKPDVFFFMKDPHLSRPLLYKLKKISPKTRFIMWYGDQRGRQIVPLIKERLGLLSGLFITNNDSKQIAMYRKAGVYNVFPFYHSFSPSEFKLYDIKPKYDVFFGGNNFNPKKFPLSKYRFELINALQSKFKMVVYGNGWPFKTEPWVLRNIYAKVLRKGIINFGINHYTIFQYYNRRLFESIASGRMHITYYIPGIEKHFVNKKHLVWFKSKQQLVNLVSYYLKYKDERERIAMEGRKFLFKKHAWNSRAQQFISLFGKFK